MRLRVTVVMVTMGDGRVVGGGQSSRCLYRPQVVRDTAHRLRECQRSLHGQEVAEQKSHQVANATVHKGKLTQLNIGHKTPG